MPARRRSMVPAPVRRDPKKAQPRTNDEVFVTKGLSSDDILTTEMEVITQRLQRLRANSDRHIRSLSGQLSEDFRSLAYYVQLLYDSPQYNILYDRIRTIFNDLPVLRPGTIGAYFGGCLERNPTLGSCSLTCVSGVPAPADEFSFCDRLVVWAVWDGKKYTLTPISEGRGDQTYVFVDVPNLELFPGFSNNEKTQLSRFGATNLDLIRYDKTGKKYIRLTETTLTLDRVPTRNSEGFRLNGVRANAALLRNFMRNESWTRGNSLIVILIVILLIILIVYGWRSYSARNGSATSAMPALGILEEVGLSQNTVTITQGRAVEFIAL